ncbi:MAG: hypothetical protein WBP70_19265 [Terriglobales bacterium]
MPRPSEAFEVVQDDKGVKVAVYLVPGKGDSGTLEHLLLRAVFATLPNLEKCLDEFSGCIKAPKAPNMNVEAKRKMSALSAMFCTENPWCSANLMWSDKGNPVPIDSPSFKHLWDFIAAFIA